MRRPVVAAMSGISVAVLGMAAHATQRTAPPAVAAPATSRPALPRPRQTTTASPKPTVTTVVVNGSPADTQYGPVQVQITLRAGRILKADAITYPQGGGRDQEINGQAVPQLDQTAVQADGAHIDTVSGATYTSDGYRRSLQSALDAAHAAGAR